METDSNNPAAHARSGQATGYATVDAALKLADFSATLPNYKKQYLRNDFEEAMHTLAAEVRRLRAMNIKLRDALGCGCGADGMCKTCSALWYESHNKGIGDASEKPGT